MSPNAKPEETLLPLTRAGAKGVRALIAEINELRRMVQTKEIEFNRLTSIMQQDAGMDPEKFVVVGVEEGKDHDSLKMVANPQAQVPVPVPESLAAKDSAKKKPLDFTKK